MKQIIIMIAMIILGIVLAGYVLSFSDTVETMSDDVKTQMTNVTNTTED